MFRTRMQASHGDSKTGHFRKTLTGIIEMTNKLGYSSLWRGLTLTLWRDVPFSGIYWWGYETIRGQLTDARERRRGPELERGRGDRGKPRTRSQSRENHTATFTDSFTAGALSGAVASLLTMPFDVGKTRQQIFKDRSPKIEGQVVKLAPEQMSMPGFLMHIFKTEGVAGLWQGWVARTLKVAPACAIMISSYEVGKRMSRSVNEKKRERESGTV
jgi:solute carrier family 25 protein 39/40